MHINYLILVHSNYNHLESLIDSLDGENVSFFIHIDKKTDSIYQTSKNNVYIIKQRNSIYWGGFGMIKATLDLLRCAKDKKNGGYYVLLSGVDFPIRSNNRIREVLSRGKEYINILPGPLEHKPMDRYEYHHFDIERRDNPSGFKYYVCRLLEKFQKRFKIKREIPYKLFVGSQWFALSDNCIEFILNKLENDKNYIKYFKWVFIPDEVFFQTIIGNSKFYKDVECNITYQLTDYDDYSGQEASSSIITDFHVELFSKSEKFKSIYGISEPLFARKFDDNSDEFVKKIKSLLHK